MVMAFSCNDLKRRSGIPVIVASVIPDMKNMHKLSDDAIRYGFIPELRFDLSNMDISSINKYVQNLEKKEVNAIFTFRSDSVSQINEMYSEASNYENILLDIEVKNYPDISFPLRGEKLILSSHYEKSFDTMKMYSKISKFECGAIKLACRCAMKDAVENMFQIERVRDERPVSFTPMGSDTSTRISSAISLSDFAYTYYEREIAPGQPYYKDMLDIMKILSKYVKN